MRIQRSRVGFWGEECAGGLILVMAFAGNDPQVLIFAALVDESVIVVDTAAVGFAGSQRFGSAYAVHEPVALYILISALIFAAVFLSVICHSI
jgi:hypothetical protein